MASGRRPARVVIADDHPLLRDGLAGALRSRPDLELIAAVGNGEDALTAIRRHDPDVALLDFRMPRLNGMQVLEALAREHGRTRVVLLSAMDTPPVIYAALEAGAAGFLSKDAESAAICDALVSAAEGETVLSAAANARLAEEIRTRCDRPVLSAREHQILIL